MTTDNHPHGPRTPSSGSDAITHDSTRRRNARLIFDAVVSGYIRDISGRPRRLVQNALQREAVSTA